MIKLVKFNLLVDEKRCRSIEDLRDNFNLLDVLEHFERGKLEKWLKIRKFDSYYEQIKAIEDKEITPELLQKLCDIFEVTLDKETLKNELEIYKLLQGNQTDSTQNNLLVIKLQQEKQALKELLQTFYDFYQERIKKEQVFIKKDLSLYEDKVHKEVWLKESTEPLSWQEANEYIDKLNLSAYLGYTSWSIPDVVQIKRFIAKNEYVESHKYYFWLNECRKYNKQTRTFHVVGENSTIKFPLRPVCKAEKKQKDSLKSKATLAKKLLSEDANV